MKKICMLATVILITATPVFANGPDVKKGIAEENSEMCENYAWAALEFAYAMAPDGFAAGAAWYAAYNNCMAISS